MDIEQYIKRAHENAVQRGDYDCPECKGHGKVYIPPKGIFDCESCNGSGIDPNKNIGDILFDIIGSLWEAREAHRCGRFAIDGEIDFEINIIDQRSHFISRFQHNIKDTREDKIADAFIRLFDFCGYLGIEPEIKEAIKKFDVENIGEAFMNINGLLFYAYENESYEEYFSLALSWFNLFCQYHNIPIQKHIEARLVYMEQKG